MLFKPHILLLFATGLINPIIQGTGPCSAVGNMSDCRLGVTSLIPAQSHTFVEIDPSFS